MGTRLPLAIAFGAFVGLACAVTTRVSATADADGAARTQSAGAPAAAAGWLPHREPGQYVGSEACQRCHEDDYAQWKSALHLQMTKPIGEAPVLGDFSPGAAFEQHGRAYRMEQKDGRYFISIAHGGRPAERFEVHYTLGALRFQGYLSTLPDGRIWVLPAFWNREARRWIDWREIAPVPDGDHDLRQIWNITCFNCHATNLARNFDVERKRFDSKWTEMGIGCEGCHGPGKPHIELMDTWEGQPQQLEAALALKSGRSEAFRIFSTNGTPRRESFDTCAYCHGNKNNAYVGFVPGDRYDDYALPFLLSEENPSNDPQGDFWPDGRPSRFNRPQALMLSGCFEKSDIGCTTCHAAHGSPNPQALRVPLAESNRLCTQCHETLSTPAVAPGAGAAGTVAASGPIDAEGPDLERHTMHVAASPGSQCINCHMSEVNWRLQMRRRDHTFRPPVPEMTAKYGVPNACTECHDDKSPEWAAAEMDRWYGDGARRAADLRVADTMYRAASGETTSAPDLARIAVDRKLGAPLRAAATQFLGRFLIGGEGSLPSASALSRQTAFEGSPAEKQGAPSRSARAPLVADRALVNSLMGAASDPEAMVRAQAVTALSAIDEPRSLAALTARLVDASRIVRSMAAEALLDRGVAQLDGVAGVALARAQDELAQRLGTFPDVVGHQLKLGWLELKRRRDEPARAALGTVLKLDRENILARVWLGVLAAQSERFDEALAHWHEVKKRRPDYPNLQQLIAEAERRKRAPGP